MFTRTRFQNGSIQLKSRSKGKSCWELRYYEGPTRQRKTVTVGTLTEYPTESAVRKSAKVQALLLGINAEHPTMGADLTMGALISRYEQQEMPERYSTRAAYRSYLGQHIRPRWEDTLIQDVKPMAAESWLNGLALAPKTKGHIRGLMHLLFDCAIRWELTGKNPMEFVRVKGGTRRKVRPRVLEAEEFRRLVSAIQEPYRTMLLIAGCLGLRVSEIMALQWSDFDFKNRALLVQRAVVHGRVGDVKTECSQDHLPIVAPQPLPRQPFAQCARGDELTLRAGIIDHIQITAECAEVLKNLKSLRNHNVLSMKAKIRVTIDIPQPEPN